MSSAGSSSVGASPKYLQIDLASTVPPFTFKAAFIAAYPHMDQNRSFVSRTIVAIDAGELTLIDADGDHVAFDFAAGESNGVMATGVYATNGVAEIKVFL